MAGEMALEEGNGRGEPKLGIENYKPSKIPMETPRGKPGLSGVVQYFCSGPSSDQSPSRGDLPLPIVRDEYLLGH